jgi:hypothetical protein
MEAMGMDSIARVSAVFLLVGVVWVVGVLGAEGDRRSNSRAGTHSTENVGVGTKVGLEGVADSGVRDESVEGPGAPLAVFREVAAGWRAGTPKPFEKYFRKGKVRLDFGEGGPRGGLYARSQAYYLIADYLKGTQTVDLGITKTTDGVQGKTRPYALLERVYRDRNGLSRKEVVFVSLALEEGQWAISEIRAIPAK